MSLFTATLDEKCQHGMHIRYESAQPVPPSLFGHLHQAFAGLVLAEERIGPCLIQRALLPFRFEVRHNFADRTLSLLLRFTAQPDQRAADRHRFEMALGTTLQLGAP